MFGGITRPAKAARRTNGMSLANALAVHLLTAIIGVLAVLLLITIDELPANADLTLEEIQDGFAKATDLGYYDSLSDWLYRDGFAILAAATAIELGIIVLAFILGPWGAVDETIRSMWGNALRQIYLHSPCVLWAIAFVGASAVWLEGGPRRMLVEILMQGHNASFQYQRDGFYGGIESIVDNETGAVLATIPWYYRYAEELATYSGFGVFAWLLWAMMTRIGARSPSPKPERAPLCEACGYNIIGIAADSRCPECGHPVAAWQGPDVRPGPAWRRRRGRFDLRAWGRTSIQLIAGPKTFGMRLPRWPADHAHRGCFALSLLIVFIAGYVGVLGFYRVVAGKFASWDEGLLAVAPIGASICTVVALLVTTAAAGTVTLWFRARHKEQLAAPAMQAAAYASSLLPLICFGACILLTVIALMWEFIEQIAGMLGIFPGMVIVVVFFGLIVSALLLYARLVGRITGGMLYANK